jgi:hypothetical protein
MLAESAPGRASAPGFTLDEPAAAPGTRLMLPPRLEPQPLQLEKALPALRLPSLVKRA